MKTEEAGREIVVLTSNNNLLIFIFALQIEIIV